MANPNQVAGRAKVTVGGVVLPTAGDTTLDLGGPAREGVDGDYDTGSFKESTKPSKLETSVLSKSGFDPIWFGNIVNETATVEYDNGQTYLVRQAYSEGRPPMGTSDGKAKCVLMGKPAERVL